MTDPTFCRYCGYDHPGGADGEHPEKPGEDDPRMQDLDDDSPQHEGEV